MVIEPPVVDELPPKPTLSIRRGDLFRHIAAGAGGWGNPLERDPERVLEDVREGKATLAHARDAYGVVIDAETLAIDVAATALRRAKGGGSTVDG